MRRKSAFVPESVAALEEKAAPAPVVIGGVFYPFPAPLTAKVYQTDINRVVNSFNAFRTNGNFGRLDSNLLFSISSLPYHHRIGMDVQLVGIVNNLAATLFTTRGNYPATQAAISAATTTAIATINNDLFTLANGGAIFFR